MEYFRFFFFRIFFMEKYDYSADAANHICSMVYLISAGASPLFGFVIDKTGRNVFWILISVISTIAAHSSLAFSYLNPYVCMVSYYYYYQSAAIIR